MWLTLGLIAIVIAVVFLLVTKQSRVAPGDNEIRDKSFRLNLTIDPKEISASGTPKRIELDGQEYSSPEDMPAGARAAYKIAMKGLRIDVNHDGVPDVINLMGAGKLFKASLGEGPDADAVAKVIELQKMRDSGEITDAEFHSRRSAIIEAIRDH
jgi:hypothetical protein